MFIDRAKIRIRGGHGGNGVTAFRREKFVARGPSGAMAGAVAMSGLSADESVNTLCTCVTTRARRRPRLARRRQQPNRSEGSDAIVRVPIEPKFLIRA